MSGGGVVFAGGGTGGHIFPMLAVLEELRVRAPGVRAVFLCSTRQIDERILSAAEVEFVPIPAAPLSVRPAGLARFVSSWGGAVRAARAQLRRVRAEGGPVRVLSTGGFVSAPVAQAARAEGVPIVLLNQDSPPGKANHWIARHAGRVFSTAAVEGRGWERIGPVVRRAAVAPGDAGECRAGLGLDPARPVLFVTGASQGARSVNEFAAALVRAHGGELRAGGWQVVHQTGAEDNGAWRAAYDEQRVPAVVETFFDAMGACWGAADLAVSRAGAGSVAEAWANRVPTVFLPYPYHRDQHQRFNAAPLERAGGAVIVEDLIDPARNLGEAGERVMAIVRDGAARRAMRAGLGSLGPVDGAARLAAALLDTE
jgi:UDP-N-acetylglucosamine--N-acetylmuramyl-(pentapeptide) pyrophosphoryl-undecaprenol N-acetylglucosamine transferase